ncbi:iron ABC transporter permease [Brevibacterium sp. BRM-1]|uniref:FecCD family ABC transporter permease n=1 Tax=Brevibacterium sp. BRM-1 TaxID=2999062 RepID=UPI00227F0C3A|nr:iron ABC transporter permease [Brevibacterium sp. BRM-1]WAL41471.1 iron ABC transporter permease [Brevibacterium sp. BRM-1]
MGAGSLASGALTGTAGRAAAPATGSGSHAGHAARPGRLRAARLAWVLAAAGCVVLAALAGIMLGSNLLSPAEVLRALTGDRTTAAGQVVYGLRLPRTLAGLVVGLALGAATAIMQSLTRNPLAEPGILGINAGASVAVVLSASLTGAMGATSNMVAAFVGAAAASAGVYFLGIAGRRNSSPVRLALAGVAISAALTAITQTIILGDQAVFNEFRFWVVGNLEGRAYADLLIPACVIVLGLLAAVAVVPGLSALALGEEAAIGLGVRVGLIRTCALIAVTLLAAAATAIAGPLTFVGLAVTVIARRVMRDSLGWTLVLAALLGAAWMLAADVLARIIVAPAEIQVGIVASLAGAPFFIWIVRRTKGLNRS